MKYLVKYLSLITISVFVFVSCSDEDKLDLDNKEQQREVIKMNLYAEKSEGNIFELMTFRSLPDKSATMHDIHKTYDSLIWIVPELGSIHLIKENSFSFQWCHNFALPGKYTTILQGYKNNEIIAADTTSILIKNSYDFLSFNWENITASSDKDIEYYNAFSENRFTTSFYYNDHIPAARLTLCHNHITDENIPNFFKESKEILYDLATSLYCEPKYDLNDSSFLEKYDELFKNQNKKDKTEPLYIWITSTSRIALIKYKDKFVDLVKYEIYAEPNID